MKNFNDVLHKLKKEFIFIKRKELIERTKLGMQKAKEEGKKLGRPYTFSSQEIREILSLVDSGMSYRKIGDKFNVSHTTIAKIKKEGIVLCEKIDSIPLTARLEEKKEFQDGQQYLNIYSYTKRLKELLEEKHKVSLTTNACYKLISEVFDIDIKEEKGNWYEYRKPQAYVELTSHQFRKN